MTPYIPIGRLKYIDGVLANMKLAGYDLDSESIAFVWKAAQGEASPAEIEAWTAMMAARLPSRAPGPQTRNLLDAIATDIQTNVDWFAGRVEAICGSHGSMP